LGISESAVSQHLKVLRQAGLVRGEKRGYFTHYVVEWRLLKEAASNLVELADSARVRPGCPRLTGGGPTCRGEEEKLDD